MSEYRNSQTYWTPPPPQSSYNFDTSAFGQPNQQFDFQTYDPTIDQQSVSYSPYPQQSYLDPTEGSNLYSQDTYAKGTTGFDPEDEPPLLEELGINPDRILRKTLAVLNPFHQTGEIDDASYLLQDSDLAGPVANCLLLAAFLLLAGSKAHFGSVYGLAMISCILMYILLSLMTSTNNITLSSIASVLGYCLLPVVALAGLNVFLSLQGAAGLILAMLTVTWAALSASRLFCTMSGEKNQRVLIAYPCILLYGVFTMIVIL